MTAWHRSKKADITLRLLGLILCGISYLAVSQLYGLRQVHSSQDPDFVSLGLATIGFLAASAGGVLTCVGNHLFDEIDLPARYRHFNGLSEPHDGW